jgi:DNA-binding transcriptional LysR family regulator
MDRFTSMGVFVKAVELGSFSAAADVLSMSPQLVGKHVATLEQHLGVRLLNRTTRRQSLTDVGATFFERARNILAEVEAAEDSAAETRLAPRGRLRVNAPVTFGVHALAPSLPKYLTMFPDISIELALSNRFVDVTDEGYDLVFRVGELADSGLVARALAPYRLILCAAPSYLAARNPPKTPMDLQRHDCLGFAFGSLRTHWDFDGPDGRISVPVSSRVMMDNGEALLAAAVAGLGIMLQPTEMALPQIKAGRLVAILPDYPAPSRPFHILYARDRRLTPKLRSFIDFAIGAFGAKGFRSWTDD